MSPSEVPNPWEADEATYIRQREEHLKSQIRLLCGDDPDARRELRLLFERQYWQMRCEHFEKLLEQKEDS
jgi:hypothetical protein